MHTQFIFFTSKRFFQIIPHSLTFQLHAGTAQAPQVPPYIARAATVTTIITAKWVKAVIGFWLPYIVDEVVKASVNFYIIASQEVFRRISRETCQRRVGLCKSRLVCITTDTLLCLALPDKKGVYDMNCVLLSVWWCCEVGIEPF
ncbi:hypothetical protein AFULGI_00013660 [Archaeoglobus fulgidus DSM 8774]|uniref:Uncharacterized protein n=1 Tax=Archaeoglobus fulgidus DSM 8774 TaxID=1344584 RepID=A0A075WEI6_ARCFL|nr:hypothetical protein AFULGI_00013660 [Archaeoglobus fulgidus DSM 8774]